MRVEVVRQESNPRFAYYMFKRLNTGGELLSEQEIRNCSIRLLGTTMLAFLSKLSEDEHFQACIEDITDEYRKRMGEQELVLRFFAFKNNLTEFEHEIHDFMTDYMERVTDADVENHIDFDYVAEEETFRRTFRVLAETLGPKAFCRWAKSGYAGGFSVSHFEAFSLGLARVIDRVPDPLSKDAIKAISEAAEGVKRNPKLRELTVGGGKNFRPIYEQKIALVAEAVGNVL